MFLKKSLKKKVLIWIFAAYIPCFILLSLMYQYAVYLIQNKVCENNLDILNANMKQIDTTLSDVSDFIFNASQSERQISNLNATDPFLRYTTEQTFLSMIKERISLYRDIEGIMIKPDGYPIYAFNESSTNFINRQTVIDYIDKHMDESNIKKGRWNTYVIDNKKVLICISEINSIKIASWTSFDQLLIPTRSWKMAKDSQIFFLSVDGSIESGTRMDDIKNIELFGSNKYLVIESKSEIGGFRMVNIIERRRALGIFYVIQYITIILFVVFFLFVIPLLVSRLNKMIFNPIKNLDSSMLQIEQGNLDRVIDNTGLSPEMTHLIDSFNNMVNQIKDLKIQTYENEIERQDIELQYLQSVIEPHFYLNALNLINTMAQVNDTELIQVLTQNLSQYMRYIVSTRNMRTTIKSEMEHINHYLKIMEVRFGNRFMYIERIDESILDFVIPPLLIQSLVENSMKYAFDIYKETRLEVLAEFKHNRILIKVKDNGTGYPEEILSNFYNNKEYKERQLGLWNIRLRLAHMYPDKSNILIMNDVFHGAITEIHIEVGDEFINSR